MPALIRKLVRFDETQLIEGGKPAQTPLRLITAAVVIQNPWAGQGFVEDLKPGIMDCAAGLGELLTAEILAMARDDKVGGGDKVECYGKAALVGTNGEVEHGSALIHTLSFGNHYRNAVGAQSYLSFSNTRAGPGAEVQIPLMDKHDAGRRSHYLTIQFTIADAPGPDEIVIALGASTGGRPHHRIGDRYQDLKDLGHDVDQPAG